MAYSSKYYERKLYGGMKQVTEGPDRVWEIRKALVKNT